MVRENRLPLRDQLSRATVNSSEVGFYGMNSATSKILKLTERSHGAFTDIEILLTDGIPHQKQLWHKRLPKVDISHSAAHVRTSSIPPPAIAWGTGRGLYSEQLENNAAIDMKLGDHALSEKACPRRH